LPRFTTAAILARDVKKHRDMIHPSVIETSCPSSLSELLLCPRCLANLTTQDNSLRCWHCSMDWLIDNKVPVLVDSRRDTQELLHRDDTAHRKPRGKEQSQRLSTRRINRNRHQLHIVTRLLSSQPASESLLNLPCSYGRLSVPMQSTSKLLIEADINLSRVHYAIEHAMNPHRVVGLCCDAFNLPLRDQSIDGILCIRFAHHLASESAQEQLLHELLRVANVYVVFSFNDPLSIPNAWRRVRFKRSTRQSISLSAIASIAQLHGAKIVRTLSTSIFGSRHRYVLIKRDNVGD
jgi:ubiquinone/menaquinone biosynthesis C-methylase UbiE